MNEREWGRWVMQTARSWDDLSPVIRSCGLDAVDDDHRRMIEYALEVNTLIETMKQPRLSMETIKREGRFLIDFLDYTAGHFRREEEIMTRYRLPRLESHKVQHKEILSMMEGVVRKFDAGEINVTKSLKVSVMDWVVSHINEVDYEVFKVEKWAWLLESAKSWDDLAVFIRKMGVDDIDDQHRALTVASLDICHLLEDSSRQNTSQEAALPLFDGFRERIADHFAYEEAFMERQGIATLAGHRERHGEFLRQFESFGAELRNTGGLDATRFARSVLSWWVNHINDTDYSSFCKTAWQYSSLERATTIEQVAGIVRSTGVPAFDREHRELVELTVSLGTHRQSPEEVDVILENLLVAAKRHFAHEEELLKRTGYPGFTNHRDEHARLVETLQDHVAHYHAGRIGAIDELRTRMLEWIVGHTNGYDYDTFIRSGFFKPEAAG